MIRRALGASRGSLSSCSHAGSLNTSRSRGRFGTSSDVSGRGAWLPSESTTGSGRRVALRRDLAFCGREPAKTSRPEVLENRSAETCGGDPGPKGTARRSTSRLRTGWRLERIARSTRDARDAPFGRPSTPCVADVPGICPSQASPSGGSSRARDVSSESDVYEEEKTRGDPRVRAKEPTSGRTKTDLEHGKRAMGSTLNASQGHGRTAGSITSVLPPRTANTAKADERSWRERQPMTALAMRDRYSEVR